MVIIIYKFLGKPGKMYELKFNSNCPDSEKSGTGPGSCGGSTGKSGTETMLPENMRLIEKNTKYGIQYELYGPEGKLALSTYDKNTLNKTVKRLEKYYSENKENKIVTVSKETNNLSNKTNTISKKTEKTETKFPESSKPANKTSNSIDPTKLPWNEAETYYKDFLSNLSTKSLPGKDIKIYKVKNTDVKVKGNFDKAELGRMLYHIKALPASMFVNKPSITIMHKHAVAKNFSETTNRKVEMGGAFSGRGITFYTDVTNQTISHELAHSVDMGNVYSNSKEYEDAIKKDRLIPNSERFTSIYARDSYAMYSSRKGEKDNRFTEDFADGIGNFFTNREKFENKFPNRSAYYKKILKL